MRLSVDKNDSGFNPRWAYRAKSFLEGKFISRVITVDEEQGYLLRYKTDSNGRVLVDYEKEETEKELLYGDVHLRIENRRSSERDN
jgi:hypothetical protein